LQQAGGQGSEAYIGRQAIQDRVILQVFLRNDLPLFDGLLGHQAL
jgi:hypothetical protein